MRLICCFYWRWNVQICLMGGESGRMFPFTLQTPTHLPYVHVSPSNSHADTHPYWWVYMCTPSCLCGSQQLLFCGARVAQTWEVVRVNYSSGWSERDRLLGVEKRFFKAERHGIRQRSQITPISQSGSKWKDARPLWKEGNDQHTPQWQ